MNYFLAKSFDGDGVKEGQKFPRKNAPKFVYKQQIELWKNI